MPFPIYKGIGEVLQEYQIVSTEANFVVETAIAISDSFRTDLEFSLRELVFDNSEYAVCENLIYPVLKEIYKSYKDKFVLWSHQPLNFDEKLCGIPDYILAKRSPLGKYVFDKPYFIVVEAKRDDFSEGWAQCLAEMIAVQKINQNLEQSVFGVVSNGKTWEFGQLEKTQFTKNIQTYSIQALEKLFASLNYVFIQCAAIADSDSLGVQNPANPLADR
jgi:hypothetical protein